MLVLRPFLRKLHIIFLNLGRMTLFCFCWRRQFPRILLLGMNAEHRLSGKLRLVLTLLSPTLGHEASMHFHYRLYSNLRVQNGSIWDFYSGCLQEVVTPTLAQECYVTLERRMLLTSSFNMHLCYLYMWSIIILFICCDVMGHDCQPSQSLLFVVGFAQAQPPAQPTALGA